MTICALIRRGARAAMCAGFPLFIAAEAMAQYDDPRLEPPTSVRYIAFSLMHREFTPRSSNTVNGTLALNGAMPGLVYHQETVDFQLGYMTYTLGTRSRSTVMAATNASLDVPFERAARTGLFFSLLVSADYTKAESSGPQRDDFNIASFGGGVGLGWRTNGLRWAFGLRAGVTAQYSIVGFSVGSGISPLVIGDATFLLRSFPLLDGLMVGYRFRLQQWNMSENLFDYRSVTQGVLVGVLF